MLGIDISSDAADTLCRCDDLLANMKTPGS
jgi:hypothetical protein